jgi:hypothetical protein
LQQQGSHLASQQADKLATTAKRGWCYSDRFLKPTEPA